MNNVVDAVVVVVVVVAVVIVASYFSWKVQLELR